MKQLITNSLKGLVALSWVALSIPLNVQAGGEKPTETCVSENEDPSCYFQETYHAFMPLPLESIRNPQYVRKDIIGKTVAAYYLDSQNLNEPVIVEGTLIDVTSQTYTDYAGDSETCYKFKISLTEGNAIEIPTQYIKEMRIEVPENVSLEAFNRAYGNWHPLSALYKYQGSDDYGRLRSPLAGKNAAFLVKNRLSLSRIVVGNILSVTPKTASFYDGSSEDYTLYEVKCLDGSIETIDSDDVQSFRVKPLPVKIVK